LINQKKIAKKSKNVKKPKKPEKPEKWPNLAKTGVWPGPGKSECVWQSIFPTFDPRRL
jgi:hypothetical protein